MWQYLLHLWATPPVSLELTCPPPPDGQTANPVGFYDDVSVANAYMMASMEAAAIVLLLVLACYLWTRQAGGPRFAKRWLLFLAGAIVFSGVVSWVSLTYAPVTALAGSCETNPDAFRVALPAARVLQRALAGLVWGGLAFFLLSLLLTRTVGRFASLRNGFFHNRGIPWPRIISVGGK